LENTLQARRITAITTVVYGFRVRLHRLPNTAADIAEGNKCASA
jgi:hypothetical protein